jgi:2'-5' RNA ligase
MSETALSVEVPEAENLVGPWRLRHDPLTLKGVPCHITVLYPFVAPDELDDPVLERVRRVLAEIRPFDFSLTGLGEFPRGALAHARAQRRFPTAHGGDADRVPRAPAQRRPIS